MAALVLFAGLVVAVFLPSARGTCGLPPLGTNEFCHGNDRMVNGIVLWLSVGAAGALIALAARSRAAFIVGTLMLLAGGLAAATVVRPSYSCRPGFHLIYNGGELLPPVCKVLVAPGVGMAPFVDHRMALRLAIVGGTVLVTMACAVPWVLRNRSARPSLVSG
jgi:hypothetical protein